MRRLTDKFVWLLLALPALLLIARALRLDAPDLEELLHPTGEWSARLLIAALAITPLSRIWPEARLVRWLSRRRRAIGLAAFGYALLHTVFYLLAMGSLQDVLAEVGATGIWTGWLAFALMLPLALTSSNAAQALLRRGWKRLQRLAYPAAILTLLHWLFVHDGYAVVLIHFAPLAVLQAARLLRRPRRTSTDLNPATGESHA